VWLLSCCRILWRAALLFRTALRRPCAHAPTLLGMVLLPLSAALHAAAHGSGPSGLPGYW
jgi:hypothetical protein